MKIIGLNINTSGFLIDRNNVKIGDIISWWRPINNDDLFPLPFNFLKCDGSLITDPESPLFNHYLPNLTDNYFIRGSSIANIGLVGGNNMIDFSHSHTTYHIHSFNHTHIGDNTTSVNSNSQVSDIGGDTWGAISPHTHSVTHNNSNPQNANTDIITLTSEIERMPDHIYILKLMRIK